MVLNFSDGSIFDLIEINTNSKSVLMREYYDLRFLTSVFTRTRKIPGIICPVIAYAAMPKNKSNHDSRNYYIFQSYLD